MKNRTIKKKIENKAIVDLQTGAMSDFNSNVKLQSYTDFFIAALVAWGTFKVSDGGKMKVFIHCIKVSSPSTADSKDGNCFLVGDVCKSIQEECKRDGVRVMSENNVRQYISKLRADDFVLKTGIRGKYRINPWFGIKGVITEKTYSRLVVEKVPKKKDISPNTEFEEGCRDVE